MFVETYVFEQTKQVPIYVFLKSVLCFHRPTLYHISAGLHVYYQKSITYMKCATRVLVHGTVLQEQWIWAIHHRLTGKVSKRDHCSPCTMVRLHLV